MRNVLIVIILILWVLLGNKMCSDYNRCCNAEVVIPASTKVEETPKVPPSHFPCEGDICFEKGSCTPTFCRNWQNIRDSIVTLVQEGKRLVITGYAKQNEENYATLGECRAKAVQEAIVKNHNISIVTAGKVRVGSTIGSRTMCDRISFRIVGTSEKVQNSTLIYFPTNSINKLADASVETYLDQVAAQLIKSGRRIRLTGHTDNVGSEVVNLDLGLKRANVIKRYLISKGLSASKIIVDSKGESQPVASNDTSVGQGKNRRTELQIID